MMAKRGTLQLAMKELNGEEILARLSDGEYASVIARELGVVGSSITRHFADDPRYRSALEDGAAVRLELAENDLRNSDTPIDVMRGSAVWKAVSWRAEKEHPERWGGKPIVNLTFNGGMDAALGDAAATLMAKIRKNEAGHQLMNVPVPDAVNERGELV